MAGTLSKERKLPRIKFIYINDCSVQNKCFYLAGLTLEKKWKHEIVALFASQVKLIGIE